MAAKKLMVQSIVFNRSKYKNKSMVRAWIKKSEYKIQKKKNAISTTPKYYKVRQRDVWRFKKSSFKTKLTEKNIRIIMGRLK